MEEPIFSGVSALQDVEGPAPAELPVGGADHYTGDQRRNVLSPDVAHQTPTQLLMGRYRDKPIDDDDSYSTVRPKSPVLNTQCVSTPSHGQSWASEPQSQPPPSGNDLFLSMQQMMDNYTCKTHDVLGGIQNTLHFVIGEVKAVKTEEGQRSIDIASMHQATRETRDKLNDVECNLRSEMREIQAQVNRVEARADRLTEAEKPTVVIAR